MLMHIGLITEIISLIFCIYCIYGEKPKLNIRTMGLVMALLGVTEIVNYYQLSRLFTLLTYVIIFFYCYKEFGRTLSKTLINILLFLVVFASVQFICMFFVEVLFPTTAIVRNVLGNILVMCICIWVLPNCRVDKLQKIVCRKNAFLFPLVIFMGVVIFFLIVQMKIFHKIQLAFYVFSIPAIIMLIYLIVKWHQSQSTAENMKKEIEVVNESMSTYDEMITGIRLQQHTYKNIIAAIFASHYACCTYEELIKVQAEYCGMMERESKYNALLSLGEPVIASFLYRKFLEANEDGIEVHYKILTELKKFSVDRYYLVVMLGILMDNAVEALKDSDNKSIAVEVNETENRYMFVVRNPYKKVSYAEIQEWFCLERSSKGTGRGLGLYHLKCLCEEMACDIGCQNVVLKDKNWIQFELYISKVTAAE